jgi:hypothetical protein
MTVISGASGFRGLLAETGVYAGAALRPSCDRFVKPVRRP